MKNKLLIEMDSINHFSPRGLIALQAAQAGSQEVLARQFNMSVSAKKGQHNYVTSGDEASENAILEIIKANFPNDAILAEESQANLEDPEGIEYLWAIDPIDGTFNYSRGIHYCAVSVGGIEKGVIKRGAIINPFSGEIFIAEEKKGAFKNGKRIQVSAKKNLTDALIDTDMTTSKLHRQVNFAILTELNPYSHIRGSLVMNMARVASGETDLYFCAKFGGPWDIVAGISLVQEANGVVFDLEGNDLTNKKGSYLATSIVAGNRSLVEKFIKQTRPAIRKFTQADPDIFK